ncbi:AGAP001660-PA-like protein, partial [Gryllus bimaculatus]
MGSPGHFSKPGDLARLWHNECQRIFMDRLICEEDLFIMRQAVAETSAKVFPQWSDSVLREPLLFGDFRNVLNAPKQRQYEDLLDYDAVYALVREILSKYNEKNVSLNLVLFDDVLEHFIRVHRVLRMHNGHMTLIGVTSSGKKSITHLAAYTA